MKVAQQKKDLHAGYFELIRIAYLMETKITMSALEQIKNIVSTIEILSQIETATKAREYVFDLAKKHTKRTKLLILEDETKLASYEANSVLEVIRAGDMALLCKTIANSVERIAAIVIKHNQASSYYYKKVRELASAEGAVMIWDELDNEFSQFTKISNRSQPDIICFSLVNTSVWIGGKKSILKEST